MDFLDSILNMIKDLTPLKAYLEKLAEIVEAFNSKIKTA